MGRARTTLTTPMTVIKPSVVTAARASGAMDTVSTTTRGQAGQLTGAIERRHRDMAHTDTDGGPDGDAGEQGQGPAR